MKKINFKLGWIDILITITILVVFASLLFPIFFKGRVHTYELTCINNIRRLSIVSTLYAQDNNNKMPGLVDVKNNKYIGWVNNLMPYVTRNSDLPMNYEIFYCPSSKINFEGEAICYGYNKLLLQPDGTGIDEEHILKPNHVGVFCDADPMEYEGGIIGTITGENNIFPTKIVKPIGRHKGHVKGIVIVGYADGHAEMVYEKYDENNPNQEVNKAFYRAVELGYIKKAGTKGR